VNVIDVLALIVQGTAHINRLAQIIDQARKDGRTELTAEEISAVRASVLASEARLEEATSE
jgi:hypothetical protein